MRLTVTEEQRAINLAGASSVLAAIDAAGPPPRRRELGARERELEAGALALVRELYARETTAEERVDMLRVLAVQTRRPLETLGQVLGRLVAREAAKAEVPTEQGAAAE